MTVTAADGDGAADTIRVTVEVTNVDGKGMVILLERHPRFGAAATSIPDGTGTDINGTTPASCTSVGNRGAVPPGHRYSPRRRGLRQEGRRDGGRGDLHAGGYVLRVLGGRLMGPVTQMGAWASDCASEARS